MVRRIKLYGAAIFYINEPIHDGYAKRKSSFRPVASAGVMETVKIATASRSGEILLVCGNAGNFKREE